MSDGFKDWIPEGEDTGAIGDGGYQDFVPAPEPKPQVIEEAPKEEQPIVPPLEQPEEQPVAEPEQPAQEGGQE